MIQTVNEAFHSSELRLALEPMESTIDISHECGFFYLFLAIAVILFITQIRTVIEIIPSLLATAIRWKESLNLEASSRLSRDRDLVAICSIIPFCLITYSFNLYNPEWMETLGPNTRLWIICGLLGIFFSIRTLLEHTFKPRRVSSKSYKGVVRVSYSFFIILTIFLLSFGAWGAVFDIDRESIRNAMLWVSALTYLLYLIRKIQILNSCCSFFTGFLYLCALEILPTGVLIASAVIF